MIKKTEDIVKAEAERRSKDLYKVYNPTTEDMEVVLNARISPEYWTIKAKEETIVPFYVAEIYAEKMYDKILYAKVEELTIAENEKRVLKGFGKMDYHTEQYRLESRNMKNISARKEKIMKILIVGLYKEYGINEGSQQTEKDPFDRQKIKVDPIIDQIVGITPAVPADSNKVDETTTFNGGGVDPVVIPVPTRRELETKAKEIGIDTSKMKNKEEIIKAIEDKMKEINNV